MEEEEKGEEEEEEEKGEEEGEEEKGEEDGEEVVGDINQDMHQQRLDKMCRCRGAGQ